MKPDTRMSHQERILGLLVKIESDLSADLSLQTLARQARFSPYHCHRIFRALVGEPVKEYVRRLRLERAAHELAFSARPIIQIAFDAGYKTHESFTRAFRAGFGTLPSHYREARKPPSASSSAITSNAVAEYLPRAAELFKPTAAPRQGRVERLRRLRVAFIRHVGPYEAVTPVFNRLGEWVGERQQGTDLMWIGVPHDNPQLTPADKLRFDCCVMVTGDIAPEGDIGLREIGGDLYATTTHYGAFEGLVETYGWLGGHFMPSAGLIPRPAPAIEIYLTNPETTVPDQLLTDILLPVEDSARQRRSSSVNDGLH
ncbi:MAG TPA: AraC family transcriptional regulator [Candidatus Polarisedimenticolaceae bacterium]|nr:AraC family transcriptional regulator [Candidatus Polarisedimenticolaceae bacterium]